jgi:uncharacterized protein (DUF736 family)
MYNLNDASFDAKEGAAIFNGGNAGIAEDITVTVVKKKPEDNVNAPDYKLVFTDSKGGACNSSFWYVEKATDYNSVDELVQKQGKVLKHIIHAIYGGSYQFAAGFDSARGLLDGCMKIIRDGLNNPQKFRIFANYGTTSSVKKYIQPRSWVPFMEPMSVSLGETRLKPGTLDAMARVEEDSFVNAPTGNANDIVEGDDW